MVQTPLLIVSTGPSKQIRWDIGVFFLLSLLWLEKANSVYEKEHMFGPQKLNGLTCFT